MILTKPFFIQRFIVGTSLALLNNNNNPHNNHNFLFLYNESKE